MKHEVTSVSFVSSIADDCEMSYYLHWHFLEALRNGTCEFSPVALILQTSADLGVCEDAPGLTNIHYEGNLICTSSNPFPVCIWKKFDRGSSNKNFRITRKEEHFVSPTFHEWQEPFKINTPAIESEAWNHLCVPCFLHRRRLQDVLLLTRAFLGDSEKWLL